MVPYRFDERVSKNLALLVPHRRQDIASYEREALDELIASGPTALADAPAAVSSLVRSLMTTCAFELDGGSVVELYGVIDFLAANTPPTEHGVPGALLIGDSVLVDVEGRVESKRPGAVYARLAGEAFDDALYPLADDVVDLLGLVLGVADQAPESARPSTAPPRSSFIQPVVAPERRIRLKAS